MASLSVSAQKPTAGTVISTNSARVAQRRKIRRHLVICCGSSMWCVQLLPNMSVASQNHLSKPFCQPTQQSNLLLIKTRWSSNGRQNTSSSWSVRRHFTPSDRFATGDLPEDC